MAHINLLPWRQTLREERKKEFLTFIGLSALAGVLIVLLAHMLISRWVSVQQERNNYLQQEITQLDEQIKKIEVLQKIKEQLMARITIIQQLQGSRPNMVRLLDEVARSIPEGLYLSQLSRKDLVVTLEGYAQSNARVSKLMRNLELSKFLLDPKLSVIRAEEDRPLLNNFFSLQVNEKDLNPQAKSADGKATDNKAPGNGKNANGNANAAPSSSAKTGT